MYWPLNRRVKTHAGCIGALLLNQKCINLRKNGRNNRLLLYFTCTNMDMASIKNHQQSALRQLSDNNDHYNKQFYQKYYHHCCVYFYS